VSLHRSEGLGLTLAEAMVLGRPVIATGYSGNLEFMNPSNSILVDYELTTLDRELVPGVTYPKGYRWARPSLEAAARAMRWVHENPEEARALGERARRSAEASLSLEAAGRRFAGRLRQIRSGRSGRIDVDGFAPARPLPDLGGVVGPRP
jgi:glycosyltransferase involved in cell wall biosynthesis